MLFSMRNKFITIIRNNLQKTYDDISEEFDQTRKIQWPEFEYFKKFVKNNAQILDLGCGNGRLYDALGEKKVDYTGLDTSSSLIDKARLNFPDAKFKLGDMADLDFPDDYFDIVFSIASFHHIPGKKLRKHVVYEMNRVLKPNGILIVMVWNLFQWKYIKEFLGSLFSFIIHFGLKYSWNDLWIKWGDYPIKRYYHAFLPRELQDSFQNRWKIEELYFVKKGTRVKFWQSYNICLIARKAKI
jgi:ubiquinone/menaquinone biosynthesis C-methylase UbiE